VRVAKAKGEVRSTKYAAAPRTRHPPDRAGDPQFGTMSQKQSKQDGLGTWYCLSQQLGTYYLSQERS
jgi:hypothetical protein